jgi:outer membrane immunogenic protein
MIRRILLASAGAMALAGTAFAADLPIAPPPPPPPPPPMWTGFYIGINAGGTWSGSNSTTITSVPVFSSPTLSPFGISEFNNITAGGNGALSGGGNSGFIGGGQIGYNYQFYNNLVAGIEADIQGIAGSSSNTSTASIIPTTIPGINTVSTLFASRSLNYLGTVRGRLGYTITPTLLVYGTGGLAYGGVNSTVGIFQQADVPLVDNGPFGSAGRLSNTRVGWTAGGGVEWMFLPNWSAKVEYLYYDLGTVTYSAGVRAATLLDGVTPIWTHVSQASTRFNGNVVRAGINYHFNWGAPAPVVAKY